MAVGESPCCWDVTLSVLLSARQAHRHSKKARPNEHHAKSAQMKIRNSAQPYRLNGDLPSLILEAFAYRDRGKSHRRQTARRHHENWIRRSFRTTSLWSSAGSEYTIFALASMARHSSSSGPFQNRAERRKPYLFATQA